MHRALIPAAAAFAVLATAPVADAAAPEVVNATAHGNNLTGGLGYTPASLTVPVGTVVAWKNTDALAPHTVTEVHGLWDLTGGYFPTPITPSGFGPGTVATRRFEAGTQQFICRVHPKDMRGVVAVPVTVSAARSTVLGKRHKRNRKTGRRPKRTRRTIATVSMQWAAQAPASGEAYDVQRRVAGAADYSDVESATTKSSGTFRTKPGTAWEIRARLRSPQRGSTDWSPPAAIRG